MKNEALVNQNWEDVVFERRNKEYGAYALRKSYSGNVVEGSFGSLGVAVIVLLIVPRIIGWFGGDTITTPVPSSPTICTLLKEIDIRSVIKRELEPPLKQINKNVAPTMTTDSIRTENNPPDSVINGDPSGTAASVDPEPVDAPMGGGIAGAIAVAEAPVDFAEEMPSYDGGLQAMRKFILKNLSYPRSAKLIGAEGVVFVRFVINTDGSLTGAEVIRGIHRDCDREAARVIGMLNKWKPGKQNHTAVAVRMVIPINFRLTGEE